MSRRSSFFHKHTKNLSFVSFDLFVPFVFSVGY